MKKKKHLVKGVEAICYGALEADVDAFFGYPITPQNDIPEFMSRELPKRGKVFLQAESEIAAINMVLGGAATGKRVLTTSSSPGVSLMSEALSYLAALELPAVVVNVMRGGPGLGGIEVSQGDYFQAVKGGGHGDYHLLVLAPYNAQEAYEFTARAFELAEKYRNPVMILSDAILGQMKEPLVLKKLKIKKHDTSSWALTGAKGRASRFIRSLFLKAEEIKKKNEILQKKYRLMQKEAKAEVIAEEGAKIFLVAFGSMARIAKEAFFNLQEKGYPVGFIRPITLYPFPKKVFQKIAETVSNPVFFAIEMNAGQMIEDVIISTNCKGKAIPLNYYPSVPPFPEDIEKEIKKWLNRLSRCQKV